MGRVAAAVRTPEAWMSIALGGVTLLLLRTIGHGRLELWDEGFHAVVASHLAKHPLNPTLYEREWLRLPYDWHTTQVWLHKPPLALWQIAVSFRLLGVDGFALRLPSVLSLWGAVLATYGIGRGLYHDRWIAALAAGLLAVNPFILGLVEGKFASDHVDMALLCYVTIGLGILLRAIRRDRRGEYVLAGVATGLAILAKGPPGLLVPGMAFALWVARRRSWSVARELRVKAGDVGILCATAATVALPWYMYAAVHWPREFRAEVGSWVGHISGNIEGWQAPWDRYIFDYMVQHAPWLYPLLVLALGVAVARALRGSFANAFVALWVFGVVLPFSFATSKVPALTVIALPALLLAFARLVVGAIRGGFLDAAVWGSGAVALGLVRRGKSLLPWGLLPPSETSWSISPTLARNRWLGGELAIALGVLIVGCLAVRRAPRFAARLRRASLVVALPVTLVASLLYSREVFLVVRRRPDSECLRELAEALRSEQGPPTVVFYSDRQPSDQRYLGVMFWSDRPVYSTTLQLQGMSLDSAAGLVRAQGGVPLLLARQGRLQDQIATCSDASRAIYRLLPPD
jgi:4-amino-4-deoxy-L-arabinose transferase-like glycosyltransferase